MVASPIIATDRESVLDMKAHRLRGRRRFDLGQREPMRLDEVRRSAVVCVLHGSEGSTPSEAPPSPSVLPSRSPVDHRRSLWAYDHRALGVASNVQTTRSSKRVRVACRHDAAERECASAILLSMKERTSRPQQSLGCSRLPRIAGRFLYVGTTPCIRRNRIDGPCQR